MPRYLGMTSRFLLAAALSLLTIATPKMGFSQQQDDDEISRFDGMPFFPEEIALNRAIFAAAPLALSVFGSAVASGEWSALSITAAAGVGVVGTGISYYHQFVWLPKRTKGIPKTAAILSLGLALTTAACAAIIGNVVH